MNLVLIVGTVLLLSGYSQSTITQHHWRQHGTDNTKYEITYTVPLETQLDGDWWISLQFSKPVIDITTWENRIESDSGDHWVLRNPAWAKTFHNEFQLKFHATVPEPLHSDIEISACLRGNLNQDISCETSSGESSGPISSSSTSTTASSSTTTTGTPTSSSTSTTASISTTTTGTPTSVNQDALQASVHCDPNMYWVDLNTNVFKGKITIQVSQNTKNGWKLHLNFSEPLSDLMIYSHARIIKTFDSSHYLLKNLDYTRRMRVEQSPYVFEFEAKTAGNIPLCEVSFNGEIVLTPTQPTTSSSTTASTSTSIAATTTVSSDPATTTVLSDTATTTTTTTGSPTPTTTSASTGAYDYRGVLHKSILFYEAQRSGKLPANNRIPWRGDSALNDHGEDGEDLTGGWYDAGDFVKFNFPQSASVTLLAWGILSFWDGYVQAGELENAIDSIKWPLDYFIKCHVTPNKFYAQVGDGDIDHSYWGRAEDMLMSRPAFFISAEDNKPGSDLAGEVSAAMAASSLVFRRHGNTSYADTLLHHAKDLFNFAYNHRGAYSDSIPQVKPFYKSWSGYEDELAYSALWLYRATGEQQYVQKAEQFYQGGASNLFSWDDKSAGALLMFYTLDTPKKIQAKVALERFLENWFQGKNGIVITPKGLSWGNQWGSLRYASNAAFLALLAAEEGIQVQNGIQFAQKQINYALGDAGHSYVCGFGHNPPQRPHHRGSSCGPWNQPCSWEALHNNPGPNPNILYGALVGGPDQNDEWTDDRNSHVYNEVATDYNAGFQSAVAGLIKLIT